SGQLPLDGGMIATALLTEREHPRVPRTMIEKWFPTLPLISTLMTRCGQVVGVTENAERLLKRGELLMIFPEGMKGSGKLYSQRYQLQKFAMGFMELSIRYKAPIIPAAVIGGEEQAPSFYNVESIAKKLGMPYFPLTPQFPWLGPLGLMPFPSKYRIYIGEPMDFSDRAGDLDKPDVIRELADSVRERVQEMVNEGLKKRPFPGF
ncbi:MAG: lysophospholipid acyltransferase family protein, partial [bacterium]